MTPHQQSTSDNGPGRTPPGPAGAFLVGNLGAMKRDAVGFVYQVTRDYGDISRIKIGPIYLYLFNTPDLVHYLLTAPESRYGRPEVYGRARVAIGNGLFTSAGDFWRRQRRIAQPSFHRARLTRFVDTMAEAAGNLVETWRAQPAGAPRDAGADVLALTIDIVCRALFGGDIKGATGVSIEELRPDLEAMMQYISGRMNAIFATPHFLPTPQGLRFRAAKKRMDAFLGRFIEERRRAPGNDLLSMLIEARDEETGEGMTDLQLRDEAMTFFFAGHETTARALAWGLWLVSLHPEVEARLRDESRRVLGDGPATIDNVMELKYTMQVVQETLRLYPPVWAMARDALVEDRVEGYRIPKGRPVIISPYALHRNPAYWPDPERFDPDRFTPDKIQSRPKYAWFPFGGGPRICIGNHFAMMEMQIVFATIFRSLHLTLAPGHTVVPELAVSLRPKGGLPMTISPAA